MRTLSLSLFFVISFCFNCNTYADSYLIHAGQLIDGKSDQVKKNVSVRVMRNQIISLDDGFIEPQADEILLDYKEHTLLPGLMDMHTHLTGIITSRSYADRFFFTESDYAYRAAKYAKDTLMAGFTTVRDLGEFKLGVTVSMKNAIAQGYLIGPRIYTATKSIATTGGHADPTNGVRPDLRGDPGPKQGVINGPEEARKAVRQRYKDGADVIKLTVTGGVLSLAKSGDNPQFTEDEIKAIVETAKDYDFTVAVHAHGAEGMKRAVRAGVDSVEHGTYMDKEVIELMKKHGTYYVPTISAGKWVGEKAKTEGYYPSIVRPKALAVGPKIQETFGLAYKAGVKIAFGTDAGVFPHGMNAKEFEYMVEAGMPAMDAIQSATIETAKLLRIDEKLGSIEVGKLADMIVVDGDPIKDISNMSKVIFVMKDGKVYKQ